MASGVYSITCVVTGEKYVGGTSDCARRWSHHMSALRRNKNSNQNLQALFDQYGSDAFQFDVLEECEVADIPACELKWIDQLKPSLNVYWGSIGRRKQRPMGEDFINIATPTDCHKRIKKLADRAGIPLRHFQWKLLEAYERTL